MERNISSAGSGESSGQEKASEAMDEARTRAKDTLNQATEKAEEVKDKAKEQAEMGRERAATGLGSAADMVRERTGESTGLTHEAGTKVAERMDAASSYLQQHSTTEIWRDVEEYVREHPGQALAGAIAAGFVVGRILR